VTVLEIALDDIAGGRIAEDAGAHRLEVCAGLSEGGTTPSIGFVQELAQQLTRIPMMVLIRPRAGDFIYTADELRVMVSDIEALRDVHARGGIGFVIGALEPSGDIDVATTRELVMACAGAQITFHKAFDGTRNLSRSIEALAELGVDRVLTSGGRRTALEGAGVIRSLVEQAGDRLTIVAGGAIRANNVAVVLAQTGVAEVHLRAGTQRASLNEWSNSDQDYAAAVVSETDGAPIRAVLAAIAGRCA
jgi:copper homeostasis protein